MCMYICTRLNVSESVASLENAVKRLQMQGGGGGGGGSHLDHIASVENENLKLKTAVRHLHESCQSRHVDKAAMIAREEDNQRLSLEVSRLTGQVNKH